jgi:hypothetical protein
MFSFFRKREFKRELEKALADGVLADDEVRYLERRSDELRIDQEYVNRIRSQHVQWQVQPILERIKATRRYSPDDEADLTSLAKDLRFTPSFGSEFRLYRALWELENAGHLTPEPIEAGIMLARGEEAYHAATATWNRVKQVRERTGYAGGAISFRVAKGVRFSVGRAIPTYSEYEGLMEISPGILYVTNKKLLFKGFKKSTSVTMGRLVDYDLYSDAIELHKTSGKPDVFVMEPVDAEYTAAFLLTLNSM